MGNKYAHERENWLQKQDNEENMFNEEDPIQSPTKILRKLSD